MKNSKLLSNYILGKEQLKNRIVMAPMTRCRANDNIPGDLQAQYYGQRSGAGLIITEGTAPSENGLGYARIPGIFSLNQIEGWKKVTSTVHRKDSKIFVQLMHTGRISHLLNMPEGAKILAPSSIKPAGQMWTDVEGMLDFPVPEEMTIQEINDTKEEYVFAAKNAMKANFDGVELHAANGYLLEQFISPISNIRTDIYGGSIEKRVQFVLEVVEAVIDVIGREKVGIRLSPYGVASDMPHYPEIDETYNYLSKALNILNIAYIHLVDHTAMGAPAVPEKIKLIIKENFSNTIILSGGYDFSSAERDLETDRGDLIAFGRPFINNPDLVERFKHNWPLNEDLTMDTFYTADEIGYTDYPEYSAKKEKV